MKFIIFTFFFLWNYLQLITSLSIRQAKDLPIQELSKRNSKDYIEDIDVSTLVEVPVSYSTGITYYYPYFYKAHLISFTEETNSFFNHDLYKTALLNNTCTTNCDYCSKTVTKCLKCSSGYFLNNGECVEYCPNGKLADTLRAKCLTKELSTDIDVVYTMAYSVGSCSNMCGKMIQDCSCAPSCKLKGNCCTNYDVVNCDLIIEKNSKVDENKCKDAGCELCEEMQINSSDKSNKIESRKLVSNNSTDLSNNNSTDLSSNNSTNLKCLQCGDGKYLNNGTCIDTCPEGLVTNKINQVCRNPKGAIKCDSLNYCENCVEDNTNKTNETDINTLLCTKCQRGTFLHNGQCVEKCATNYRADRITWTCLESPVFGWYWVFPTKSSCRGQCNGNEVKNDNKDINCFCNKECVQEGNCCPDYDFYCEDVYYMRKKDSNVDKNKNKKNKIKNKKNK